MRVKFLLTLFFIFCSFCSFCAQALPREAAVAGGVVFIDLGAQKDAARPQVHLAEQPLWVSAKNGRWVAVLGLSLETPVGSQELILNVDGAVRSMQITVQPKKYPEQHIQLKDDRRVTLSERDAQRVQAEGEKLHVIKKTWRDAPHFAENFIWPVNGRKSGGFGLRRFYNGQARSPHNGFDIAVPTGTPVKTGASGRVIDTGDYFFSGKTVFVDHGNGLISLYCHLSHIDAQVGDMLKQGQVLGLAGMSGRATGPHLHWSVILNGSVVDPALFVLAEQAKK